MLHNICHFRGENHAISLDIRRTASWLQHFRNKFEISIGKHQSETCRCETPYWHPKKRSKIMENFSAAGRIRVERISNICLRSVVLSHLRSWIGSSLSGVEPEAPLFAQSAHTGINNAPTTRCSPLSFSFLLKTVPAPTQPPIHPQHACSHPFRHRAPPHVPLVRPSSFSLSTLPVFLLSRFLPSNPPTACSHAPALSLSFSPYSTNAVRLRPSNSYPSR